jgi:CSLREA domain-containing protein
MRSRRPVPTSLKLNPRIIFVICLSLFAASLASTTGRVASTNNYAGSRSLSDTKNKKFKPAVAKIPKQEGLAFCPSTLTVDDDGDGTDATPGDGICATAGSVCTLRAAIQESNALSSCGLTIDFTPGIHDILTNTALPAITSNVTIAGPTAAPNAVKVDGQTAVRVFEITTATTVAISNLTIANGGSGVGSGGGLLNSGAATVTVSNSSFFANEGGTSGSGGGAVANTGTGTLNLRNSTLVSNGTGGDGAGVYGSGGTINILNCTIVGNIAFDVASKGGGIANNGSSISVKNTIVAFNFAGMSGPDVFGVVTSGGHNLISIGNGSSGFTNGVMGDQVGTDTAPIDPRLDVPGDNGGTTDTVPLLPGSPAIDAGDDCIVNNTCVPPTGFVTKDQRGVTRPQGNHVDIGAFELEGYVVNTTADLDPSDGACTPNPGGCTLRDAIEAANADAPSPRLIAFNIPDNDLRHTYYVNNGVSGVSAGATDTTSWPADAIPNIDPEYPYSWWSIAPVSPLPDITNTVFINGYSQPGASVNTKHFDQGDDAILRIELTGIMPTSGSIGLDLELGAGGSTISGLVVNNFAQTGVFVCGDGFNEISGNFIGTDVSGTLAQGSAAEGVALTDGGFNLVGGDAPAARNLISGHASRSGVDITSPENIVEGNYIGTDRNGLAPLGNKFGVRIQNGVQDNVIGCEVLDGSNLISGNSDSGVFIDASDFNLVIGNFIGTNSPGTGAIANGIGVNVLDSSDNSIAFIPGAAGNVISGNTGDGVLIKNSSTLIKAEANIVQGNLIGTDKTGLVKLANGGAGVEIEGSNYNKIGSTVPAEGNVMSGNTGDGVEITGGASNNLVQGNFIGVAADGTAALGNVGSGVEIYTTISTPGASNNIIGFDTFSETSTFLSAGRSSGIAAVKQTNANRAHSLAATESPAQSSDNRLTHRISKALISRRQALRALLSRSASKVQTTNKQSSELRLSSAQSLTLPPGLSPGANVIANNGVDGVKISNPADINNLIVGNSIYSNNKLGINLVGGTEASNGVTANDLNILDADDGPNHLQNFPDLTGADANTQTITGVLHSSPGDFQIDFYLNATCDGSGYGEGKRYIGRTTATANGSGDAAFTFSSSSVGFTAGQFITATATDVNGNTSEFSACLAATAPPPPATTPSFTKGPDQSVAEDSGAQIVTNWATNISPAPDSGRTATFIIQNNTNLGLFSNGPAISPSGTLTYTPAANVSGSATITIAFTESGGSTSPSQIFVITVTEVNDAPGAVNDTLTNVAEDSGVRMIPFSALTANDSKGPADESSQTLIVKTVSNPVGGTVSIAGGNVLFTPTADYNGPASFQFTVEDNGTTNGVADPKTSGTATVSFTITEVNDAPAAVSETLSNVAENSGQRTIPFSTLTANDSKGPANESGQALIVKTVGNAVGGTISISGSNVLFTPATNYKGPASFDYTIEDNGTTNGVADPKTSGTATASFNISDVNQAPTAVNDGLGNMAEDAPQRTIPFSVLTANDSPGPPNESGQTLIVKTVSNPVGITVSIVGSTVRFTPLPDYNGPASFKYTVEDNGTTNGVPDPKTSAPALVHFNITEVNDAPAAVNDTLTNVAEDSGQRTIPFAALTANDSKGPANESGQTLIVKTVGNAVGGTVSIAGGNVLFTPTADYSGPASFNYTVEDNGTTDGVADPKSSGAATVTFSVTQVNDAPVAVNDTLTNVAEDSGQRTIPFSTLTTNDSKGPADESGQTLTVKTVSNAIGGTVSILGGNVLFTPTADYNGPASFQYTVEDNGTTNGVADPKTSATATVSFTITPVADAPSVTNATTNANTQTTSGLVISRNPADGAEVTHFKITGITGGSLFKNNGLTPINNGDFITFAEGNAGLKFTPGTVNGSFTVQASLSASDAGLSSLGGGMAIATIIINPLGGVIRFSAANYTVAEGAGFKTITVERTGDATRAVTVDYVSTDHSNPPDFIPCTSPGAGQASSRCDFTTAIGTLRFAAGETSKTFNVLISQDNYVEGPEMLSLTLSNLRGGAVFGVPQTAILSITDDITEAAANPIDTSSEFVKAQYHDILGRESDAAGLAFWTDNIEKCKDPARRPAGQTVAQCIDKQREATAIAFFMSPEFQMTGGFVFHLYKGSLTGTPNYDGGSPNSSPGRFPTFLEFMHDMNGVSEGIVVNNQISGAAVEANRSRLAAEFVLRPEFIAKYGGLNDTLYVQELFNTTGIVGTAAQKQTLVDGLGNGTETRASVLRKIVDGTVVISEDTVHFTTPYGQAFINQENRRLFVYLEYIGYLRRNPDTAGFVFWLGKLNFFNGDPFQAEMVKSFILSPEYRSRFGQP